MKILPVNYSQNHIVDVNRNENYISYESLKKDTFIKSPSFGNAQEVKLAQEILSNPTLRKVFEQFTGNVAVKAFLSLFGIALAGKAAGELTDSLKITEEDGGDSAIQSFLDGLIQNSDAVSKLRAENDELRQENESLKGENAKLKEGQGVAKAVEQVADGVSSEQTPVGTSSAEDTKDTETSSKLPSIPLGVCSGLDLLDKAISDIHLDDEYNAKLKFLLELMIKETVLITCTGTVLNRNRTATNFAKELEAKVATAEETICKYYGMFGPKEDNCSEAETVKETPVTSDDTEESPVDEDAVPVVFPKRTKRGALNKEQKELKAIVETIKLPEEEGKKLTEICAVAISDVYVIPGGKILYGADLTKMLIEHLKSANNISLVIAKVYDKLELNSSQVENAEAPVPSEPVPSQESAESWKQYVYNSFGTVPDDLFQVNYYYDRKLRMRRISSTTSGELVKVASQFKRNIVAHKNEIFAYVDEQIQEAIDENDNSENLDKSHPKMIWWLKAEPVPERISAQDIIDELGNSFYKNIGDIYSEELRKYHNPQNCPIVTQIVDLINEEPMFQHFTIHAAMKLIERLVDFESGTPIEMQVENILNELMKLLKEFLKQEQGAVIDTYIPPISNRRKQDGTYETIIKFAPQITMSKNMFDKQQKKIFGSYDIEITLCETHEGGIPVIKNIIMQKPRIN